MLVFLVNLTTALTSQSAFTRDSQVSSFRLYIHHDQIDIDSADEELLINHAIPIAVSYFSRFLSLNRISSKLVLQNIQKCGGYQIPSSHKSTGVEADFILYVFSTFGLFSDETQIGLCHYESGGRHFPLVGFMDISQVNWQTDTIEGMFGLLAQAVISSLGFHQEMFQYFTDENQNYYTHQMIIEEDLRDHESKIMIFPKVLQRAQNHFNCHDTSKMDGVQIQQEDETYFWNGRTILHDVMSQDFFSMMVYVSHLTAAVLESTGWFEVDYNYSTDWVFGKNQGCDFITEKCINEDQEPRFDQFCSQNQKVLCHHTLYGVDGC